jgi:hypothetical protein
MVPPITASIGVDYSDIKFMSVAEQENLAKNVALGLVTLPIGGGAVALVRTGYVLKVWLDLVNIFLSKTTKE